MEEKKKKLSGLTIVLLIVLPIIVVALLAWTFIVGPLFNMPEFRTWLFVILAILIFSGIYAACHEQER